MKKIISMILLFLSISSYAYDVHVTVEPGHCSKMSRFIYITTDQILKKNSQKDIFYLNNSIVKKWYKSISKSKFRKKIKRICKSDVEFDLIDMLSDIEKPKNKNNKFLFFSNMSYKNDKFNIDFTEKVPNDAWLYSRYSPFNKMFKKLIDNEVFKNSEVVIITNENNISLKTYQGKKRFYYLMFKKLGAKLKYYGPYIAYTANYKLIKNYFLKNNHVYENQFKNDRIQESELLMLDDRTINLNLGE